MKKNNGMSLVSTEALLERIEADMALKNPDGTEVNMEDVLHLANDMLTGEDGQDVVDPALVAQAFLRVAALIAVRDQLPPAAWGGVCAHHLQMAIHDLGVEVEVPRIIIPGRDGN